MRTRLSSLRLSPAREAEIVDELSQHLDDRYRELIAGGATPDAATRLALAEFRGGNVLGQYMAPLRQSNSPAAVTPGAPTEHVLMGLWQDLRYAARMLRKQPGFAAVATVTLALGIGANTAIFSVLYGVLLMPLPFHEPERLVSVWHRAPGLNIPLLEQGAATYFTYRESHRVFEDIALWDSVEVSITGHGEPERAPALRVTDGLLSILRVQPLLGRFFTKEDDAAGSRRSMILTHGYWQRRFGGAPDVIGRSLDVNGGPSEIIGVLPQSFRFLHTDPAVLLPFRFNRAEVLVGDFSYRAVARLKPDVTLDRANADLARMIPLTFERFGTYPGLTRKMFEEARIGPNVRPLSQDAVGDVGRLLWILTGTVGIVLLIACANVANLFLVRAEGRHQELAVRAALGASRSRLARELLSESIELSLVAGALGLLLAWAGIRLLTRLAPAGLPRIEDIGIDLVVLVFALAISILTGLLFGLIPVIRFRTAALRLNEGGRAASDAPGRQRWRNVLAVSEIASALVLLVVAGLMTRTFIALHQVDPGFVQPKQIQTFRVSIPEAFVRDPHHTVLAYEQITHHLEQVPGVVSVGLSSSVTMDHNSGSTPIFIEDFPDVGREMPPLRRYKRVGPGYFDTMGNPVRIGRALTWTDMYEGRPVVVISENLAREYWKNPADALGRRITQSQQNPWREIVGIVGNEREDGLGKPAPTIVYWPLLLKDWWNEPVDVNRTMAYVVRSVRVGSPSFVRELQQAVWSVNPNLPLASVRTLDEIQAQSMAQTSFALVMLALAAAVALLLGSVGIYSVIAYTAAQRTREIGIRIALGAQIRDVRRMFLCHGLWLTTTGIALGVCVALGLTRVMSALLFGVGPTDPTTYIAVSAALAAVALLATYLPARRASAVDPIMALRSDL
ncbi:MAG TPA: ABC transporter permease [Vicinamibacterales bacterium]|nr:ABC transporter permease [Vicinamibacterales bacterium]